VGRERGLAGRGRGAGVGDGAGVLGGGEAPVRREGRVNVYVEGGWGGLLRVA